MVNPPPMRLVWRFCQPSPYANAKKEVVASERPPSPTPPSPKPPCPRPPSPGHPSPGSPSPLLASELEAELKSKKVVELKKRALADGVSSEEVEAADDAEYTWYHFSNTWDHNTHVPSQRYITVPGGGCVSWAFCKCEVEVYLGPSRV